MPSVRVSVRGGRIVVSVPGRRGLPGTSGWTPVLAIVTDGARRVHQVVDYTGGTGTKPSTGLYVGASGLVTDIADAVDIGASGGGGSVTSVAGRTGDVVLAKADVGLGNVNNTADGDKPVSTAQAAADAIVANAAATALSSHISAADPHPGYQLQSAKGQPEGYANLDAAGKIPAGLLPSIAIVEYLGAVASQSAMLALVGQKGDWCVRTDTGMNWIITGNDPTQIEHWTQLTYPASPVTSVAGRTGDVVLAKADVGLGNVDNTADGDKPVSTAQAAADAIVANAAATALSSHVSAADPHTGYQKETEKGQANGYASLDGDGKVPAGQLPASVSSVMNPRSTSFTTPGSTTASIPIDISTPESSEGYELIKLSSVTPVSASSTIEVTFAANIALNSANNAIVALFIGTNSNASATNFQFIASGQAAAITCRWIVPSWSGAKDIAVRVGSQTTLWWNRAASTLLFGSSLQVSLSAKELSA